MWLFIIALLFIAGGALAVAYGAIGEKDWTPVGAGAVCVFLGVILCVLSMIRLVPTKSVGVITSLGKIGTDIGPGGHFPMAPWATVNIITTRIQTTTFEGRKCLSVRIGGQQEACLDATIQWHVLDPAAPGLFGSYGAAGDDIMTDITNAVVVREFKQSVNQQLGDYNPIVDVAKNGQAGNSQFTTFGPLVLRQMRSEIGGRIQVLSVIMPFLHYDRQTQDRLNAIQTQFADTAIADQEVITNAALAKANDALAKSVSHDPNVLIAQCLSLVQNAVKTNSRVLPPGFSCFGPGSALALSARP